MNKILIILKKELKELFRDRKSLSMMLVIPIFIPLLIFGMSALFESQVNKPIETYNKVGFAYELSEEERKIAEILNIDIIEGGEIPLYNKLTGGEISIFISKENNNYTINSKGFESVESSHTYTLVNSYFSAYKESLQKNYLEQNNINSEEVINIIHIDENILESKNFYVAYIITFSFLFIIMAITVSATYPSTDTTAGEKERGTMETLLTFPIKSRDILTGKYLSVTLSSIITGLFSMLLVLISLPIANRMFSIYDKVNLSLPLFNISIIIIVIILYSLLISGICIAIASKCKTFKEAQSALTPLTFLSFFPGMVAFMIGINTTSLLAIVPFLNFAIIFTDITNGICDYLNITLMIVSTIIYSTIIIFLLGKLYKKESILF